MAFCSMPRATDLALSWGQPGSSRLLAQFTHAVRVTLAAAGGYECQEKRGTFMLAFPSMRSALEWSLLLQLALLQVSCSQYHCLPSLGPSLKIQVPHVSTSRAHRLLAATMWTAAAALRTVKAAAELTSRPSVGRGQHFDPPVSALTGQLGSG
jgi:hypothetical protein